MAIQCWKKGSGVYIPYIECPPVTNTVDALRANITFVLLRAKRKIATYFIKVVIRYAVTLLCARIYISAG